MLSIDYQVEHHYIIKDASNVVEKGTSRDTPFRVDKNFENNKATKGKICLKAFTAKGGKYVHLDPKKKQKKVPAFALLPNDIVFPSCAAGFNRSQTLYAILAKFTPSITLIAPHATRMGFDPFNDKANWRTNLDFETDSDGFFLWAGHNKVQRFGFDRFGHLQRELNPPPEDLPQEVLLEIRKYYDENYFGPSSIPLQLKGRRRVYITFAANAHVIIHRLNQANLHLRDVIVVGINLDDFIHRPRQKEIVPKSPEAYAAFEQLIRQVLDFSQLSNNAILDK